MLEFLTDQGCPPDIEIILSKFPKDRQESECILLLGTYLEMVEKEVIMKQKELLVNTVIGVLTTKAEYVRRRAVPRVQIHLQ